MADGTRGGYQWLWSKNGMLRGLIERVPDLVTGKVVAVTSFDSGPLQLTDPDLATGWRSEGGVAYSPPLEDASTLPLAGWDECYVLDALKALPTVEVFVNYGDFNPNPDRQIEPQGPGWDRLGAEEALRHSLERTERFWAQLVGLDATSYLAENDAMICVTKDVAAFDRALAYARDEADASG